MPKISAVAKQTARFARKNGRPQPFEHMTPEAQAIWHQIAACYEETHFAPPHPALATRAEAINSMCATATKLRIAVSSSVRADSPTVRPAETGNRPKPWEMTEEDFEPWPN